MDMNRSAAERRAFTGPALWSFGFRPFFLFGALWAALAMAGWAAMLAGWRGPPTYFQAVDWHAHEMLFGYLSASVAGFLLTAVPNWTGRYPILGWPLFGLFALWLAGRIVMLYGAALPQSLPSIVDLAFLAVLGLAISREIVAGRNWRNLTVLALIVALAVANGIYHSDALSGRYAAGGLGARLAIAAATMLIIIIGGRIVPSFTRNWLAKNAPGTAEPAPYSRYDTVAIGVSLAALLAWTGLPGAALTAVLCTAAGVLNIGRLARWKGYHAGGEALVWILHAGYAFVPLGFVLIAVAWAAPALINPSAAQHAFNAGAVGVMTLAVMTRASLGHTGRALSASRAVVAVYAFAIASAFFRIGSGFAGSPIWLLHLAAASWIAAFAGFAFIYTPILIGPRQR